MQSAFVGFYLQQFHYRDCRVAACRDRLKQLSSVYVAFAIKYANNNKIVLNETDHPGLFL